MVLFEEFKYWFTTVSNVHLITSVFLFGLWRYIIVSINIIFIILTFIGASPTRHHVFNAHTHTHAHTHARTHTHTHTRYRYRLSRGSLVDPEQNYHGGHLSAIR